MMNCCFVPALPVCDEGSVRLTNNPRGSLLDGRVEVCVNGVWGTVCNEGFDKTDATVFCRQLGRQLGVNISSMCACVHACSVKQFVPIPSADPCHSPPSIATDL